MCGPLRAERIAAAQTYPACPERFGTGRCVSSKESISNNTPPAPVRMAPAASFIYPSRTTKKYSALCLLLTRLTLHAIIIERDDAFGVASPFV